MSVFALGLALSTAHAAGFGTAKLIDGEPEFQGCLTAGSSCEENFFAFLTESMLEQGFAMDNHPVLSSAVVRDSEGFLVGGALQTFPFGAPAENLSGKEENTQFSPVFPRLMGAWSGPAGDGAQPSVGLSFLPPVPVGGASALLVGLDGALAWSGADSRFGPEFDLTFVQANAPIVASEEQFEDRDSFSNPDNIRADTYAARCGGEGGCIDTFTMVTGGLRYAMAWNTSGAWVPYGKVGLTVVQQRLYVMYDDTTWGIFGVQPQVHSGLAWFASEHAALRLGASAGLRQSNQGESGKLGAFTRIEGSAGWRF